jgi:hypothetical protein
VRTKISWVGRHMTNGAFLPGIVCGFRRMTGQAERSVRNEGRDRGRIVAHITGHVRIDWRGVRNIG